MTYKAPLNDMKFLLEDIANMEKIAALPGYEHATPDMVGAILEEAAKLAENVWAPLNNIGDREGSSLSEKSVRPATGFKAAYLQYAAGGWNGFTCHPDHGGQGLPWALGMAVNEMWQSANMALSLCPLLTAAAIEAIAAHGTDAQKKTYLPHLVSGHWTGTMQLTEPQAGTDLAAIRTVAQKNGDHYLMKGQKIFITFGDHDFTDNIIHLVLAHVDGLPEGNDGLGLFIVPKYLVEADGSPGARNDVYPVAVEHKLGIHGSPTCVMQFGDNGGAVAYLVGEEGKGLRNMFTMMNNARIGVGLQGVALQERAYQHALAYAKERVQATKIGDKSGKRVAIIEHADIRRMLMTMKAHVAASRALAYYAGSMIDMMRKTDDAAAAARVDLLTPLVKAWSTDLAVETASLGVQIHGGAGFIEETGAAQHYRDARILPIYEGTNGIQANDLVFRKVVRDEGAEAMKFIGEMRRFVADLPARAGDDLHIVQRALSAAADAVSDTTAWIVAHAKTDTDAVAGAAVPYLRQFAMLAGGYMLAQSAWAAHARLMQSHDDADFYDAKIMTARFYAEALLPQVHGLSAPVMGGHKLVGMVSNDSL